MKVDLERNTRLTCWFDLDRMGAGINLNTAMHDGVKLAEVFVCCLTDRCASDPNAVTFPRLWLKRNTFVTPSDFV